MNHTVHKLLCDELEKARSDEARCTYSLNNLRKEVAELEGGIGLNRIRIHNIIEEIEKAGLDVPPATAQ
jgi:hypothetical protein